MKKSIILFLLLVCLSVFSMAERRWNLDVETNTVVWEVADRYPYYDHVEMSGDQLSAVIRYGVDEKKDLFLERSLNFPMLRTIPNNTHASLKYVFKNDPMKQITFDGALAGPGKVEIISQFGNISFTCKYLVGKDKVPVEVVRNLIISPTEPALIEFVQIMHQGDKPIKIGLPKIRETYNTPSIQGVYGSYSLTASSYGEGEFTTQGNAPALEYFIVYSGTKKGESLNIEPYDEWNKRGSFVNDTCASNLVLMTPDPTINRMFDYAKLRASESIFKTKNGYVHSPGGESYYAAIWANDQAEYVNPFFPFLGYKKGNLAAMTSFRWFAKYMNAEYKPLPSSIIAEGTDIWAGKGDRGDAAMIAYGAARYALASGNATEANELWSLITWCLEYCKRQLNDRGVVTSDTDELENRFPAGKANLSTSSLYFDALISAGYLGESLGKSRKEYAHYAQQAQNLHKAIESYFGTDELGYHTYRYYEGNTKLRSWICMPLTMGIYDRAKGTCDALFSTRLRGVEGFLTEEGSSTFWDRSTLYAIRGMFAAGDVDRAWAMLSYYSERRLLGDHVPYAIEASPEGKMRQLSAESALYCRAVTEGLFGIRPTGFNSFDLTPRLPKLWNAMSLRKIKAFGAVFNVEVVRTSPEKYKVVIRIAGGAPKNYECPAGGKIHVNMLNAKSE